MSRIETLTLALGALLAAGLALYPEWDVRRPAAGETPGLRFSLGNSWLWSPPSKYEVLAGFGEEDSRRMVDSMELDEPQVNWLGWGVVPLCVLVLTIVVVVSCRRKRLKRHRPTSVS